mmetsp:Transcript_17488/g.28776  ORF Transcript_17488/g.28776 Transcript_17488/m.28776 type:complete len:409 (-) Transcript_17488:139-1365(-)
MPSLTEKEEAPSAAEATDGQMLLLTASPGNLGLTIRLDKLGGSTITAIGPACHFKNRVEVGDRIVTIDGQKVSKNEDFQMNKNKQRQLGVVKKIQQTTKNQQAPPSSTQMTAGNAALTPVANDTKGNPVVNTENTTATKKHANKKNEADETSEDDCFQVTFRALGTLAATLNQIQPSTGTGTAVMTASASGDSEVSQPSSLGESDDIILSQHYRNNLRGVGLRTKLEELGQETELQEQQNDELKQKHQTVQQEFGDGCKDDDESVIEITDRSSFYFGLCFEKGSGKPVDKPSNKSKVEKAKKEAANDVTLSATTPPTPTRNQMSIPLSHKDNVTSDKQVVTPSCTSASGRSDDDGGDDEVVDNNDMEEEVVFGEDDGGWHEDNITSSNVNLLNNLADKDLQTKLDMVW